MRSSSVGAAAVGVTLGAALVLGCGGGGRPTAGLQPSAPASNPRAAGAAPARGAYRWLVPTSGSQPTIAIENRNRGTTAWRLPGPAADVGGLAHGPIAAYVASQALAPGQVERVYASDARARYVRVRVFRMGWYEGSGGREVLRSARLPMATQPPCAHESQTGLTQCRWHPTLSFTIPPALATGVYIAQLSTDGGDQSDCLFVVSSTVATPLLAQLPTATYEAYNAWGGDSLYPGGARAVGATGTGQGVEVSYDRPYDSVTGAGQFFTRGDVSMIMFLERYGFPVSYTDSEAVDRDPGSLTGHRVLLDFGHSEYWSQRQADAWRRARDHATNLVFLGSDTMAWRIRFLPGGSASSEAGAPAHVIVAYKEHAALDSDRGAPTGGFPAGGAPLTGSAYVGCITPRIAGPGPPAYHYYSWSPAPSLKPAWLFAGTRVSASTSIPGITGYELDQLTSQSPVDATVIGRGSAPCQPSGVTGPGEPSLTAGQHFAQTTLYRAPSGALVFNTGTLGWELGLAPVPSASPDAPRAPDPRVVGMTGNLLDHLLR